MSTSKNMLSIEQIGSQFWLVRYEDNGAAFIAGGPYPTREQAEVMTKLNDN